MKLTIDIDDDLMRRATRLTGLRTKREVVEHALQTLVRLKEQERIRRYRGKLPLAKLGASSRR
jgi:Arc/MetJ family transcription regulator